jgi:hypothetical protein
MRQSSSNFVRIKGDARIPAAKMDHIEVSRRGILAQD